MGGALQEPAGKIRLFQYWDECGGVLNSGRCHVDPNAITLEAFQSPVLLDGHGSLGPELVPLPPDTILDYIGRRRIETVNEYILSSWGGTPTQEETIAIAMAGSVGQSNSVVLNGESWYVPLGPRSGRGQALHRAGPLQAIRSDATEYYTDRYSLSRITRSTILVGGKYVLVSDRVIADTPHEVTWQAFVREKAKIEGNRLVIETAEQVRCDLVPLQPGTLELTPAKDYPIGPAEGRSVRVQHTLPAATDTRIDVAMVPQHCLAPLADLTDGWERELSGHRDAVSLATAYLSDPATDPDTPRIFRRQITIRRNPDIRHFLVVEIASVLLEVNVNGLRVSATTTHPQGIWSESATFLPWVFDITEALRDGDNEILLRAPFFHGETICGPIRLCIEQDPLPVDFVRAGADTFAATVGEETDQIVMDRTGGVAPWAGGETDARYAVLLMNGTVAACDVTALSLPSGFRLQSSAPCDVYWAQLETALTSFVDGGSVEIVWAQGQLSLEISGCVNVTYSGDGAHSLTLHLPAARTVLVNGGVVGRRGGGASPTVTIELTPSAEICSVPTSAEEVYGLAERCGAVSGDALVEALSGDDWRVQMAAADVIGRLRIARAVPLLLQRFAEAEAELPYPALTKWWRASKMLRGDYEEGPDPALPLPLAVKRWRVKRAVVTALGKLGDRRAVEPLEAALARCDDFFPVTSQLAVALGRLGSPNSVSVLERHAEHAEINLRVHARLSLALLKGEIDRRTFETRVGAG